MMLKNRPEAECNIGDQNKSNLVITSLLWQPGSGGRWWEVVRGPNWSAVVPGLRPGLQAPGCSHWSDQIFSSSYQPAITSHHTSTKEEPGDGHSTGVEGGEGRGGDFIFTAEHGSTLRLRTFTVVTSSRFYQTVSVSVSVRPLYNISRHSTLLASAAAISH